MYDEAFFQLQFDMKFWNAKATLSTCNDTFISPLTDVLVLNKPPKLTLNARILACSLCF